MARRKPQKDVPHRKVPPEPLAADDTGLFRRAVSGATPLTLDRVDLPRRRVRAKAQFSRLDERQALRESLEDPPHAVELENGSALFFRRSSVHPKVMRRLARGGVSVQGHLDLHGLTAMEAREALSEFIQLSLQRGHTCVRVVHGKGHNSGQQGPVLKRKVDTWLRRWEPVLAFVSARQVDGGTGAVYVLLKK